MTNITQESIEKFIFDFLDNGGNRKNINNKINEFINLSDITNSTDRVKQNSSSRIKINIYDGHSSILDDPFFWLWLSNNHSHGSSSGCIGGCSSSGSDDGEGMCILLGIICCVLIVCLNAYLSYITLAKLKDSKLKNNGHTVPTSFVLGAAQISVGICLILFCANVFASEGKFTPQVFEMLQIFSCINAAISLVAGGAFLLLALHKMHERSKNREIASACADIAISQYLNYVPLDTSDAEGVAPEPSAPIDPDVPTYHDYILPLPGFIVNDISP
jgi:hypothetical protein